MPDSHLSPAEAKKFSEEWPQGFHEAGLLTTTEEIKAGLLLLRRNGLDAARRHLETLDRIKAAAPPAP